MLILIFIYLSSGLTGKVSSYFHTLSSYVVPRFSMHISTVFVLDLSVLLFKSDSFSPHGNHALKRSISVAIEKIMQEYSSLSLNSSQSFTGLHVAVVISSTKNLIELPNSFVLLP